MGILYYLDLFVNQMEIHVDLTKSPCLDLEILRKGTADRDWQRIDESNKIGGISYVLPKIKKN